MVGMTADRKRKDDDARHEVADGLDHHFPAGVVVEEVGIGQSGVPAFADRENLRSAFGLLGSQVGAAAGAGLARGQDERVARRVVRGTPCPVLVVPPP